MLGFFSFPKLETVASAPRDGLVNPLAIGELLYPEVLPPGFSFFR